MISTVNLQNAMIELVGKHCQPLDILQVNDQIVRMAYINGEFHWHKHTQHDELFYILKGKLTIQLREQPNIILKATEMAVIPKGVMHCPKSLEPSFVLLFEPISLRTNGD